VGVIQDFLGSLLFAASFFWAGSNAISAQRAEGKGIKRRFSRGHKLANERQAASSYLAENENLF